jgi:hypothetical protein
MYKIDKYVTQHQAHHRKEAAQKSGVCINSKEARAGSAQNLREQLWEGY